MWFTLRKAWSEEAREAALEARREHNGESSKPVHPFVRQFLTDHPSTSDQREHLSTVPKEKLMVAHGLVRDSEHPDAVKVRRLIERELDDRANRGA